MPSEDSPASSAKQILDSTTALMKTVPVYEDGLQPVVKEVGKALGTIGKAVNVALAPISLSIWGYDRIQEFLEDSVAKKLEDIPPEQIKTPPPHVAGPAIEALKFSGQNEDLRNMFANLLANSMDEKTAKEAHPSFVYIINNLSPDEGRILKLFIDNKDYPIADIQGRDKEKGTVGTFKRNISELGILSDCDNIELTPNYIDNLCRLGILTIPHGMSYKDKSKYDALYNNKDFMVYKEMLKIANLIHEQGKINEIESIPEVELIFKRIEKTDLGVQFINSCVKDKSVEK